MNHKRMFIIIAVALIAVVLIGEVYVYSFSPSSSFSVESSKRDDGIGYSMNSGVSTTYDMIVSDNGGFEAPRNFYFYRDSSYKTFISPSDADHTIDQLRKMFGKTGITVNTLASDSLKDMLASDIASGKCNDVLICVTGDLPDTVYTGKETDTIFEWIHAGGRLYWAGNVVGSYYSTREGVSNVWNCQKLFLGCDCINNTVTTAYGKITDNDYCDALHLQNNQVLYSADMTKIAGVKSLSIGYSESNCASVSLFASGDGMVCIFGGLPSKLQREDMVQVISSHICYKSVIIEHKGGNLARGTVSGIVRIDSSVKTCSFYGYFGGCFMEYGRTYDYSF